MQQLIADNKTCNFLFYLLININHFEKSFQFFDIQQR